MKNLKYYPNHITSSITYINIGICYTDGKINFIVYNQNLCDELINDIQNKIYIFLKNLEDGFENKLINVSPTTYWISIGIKYNDIENIIFDIYKHNLYTTSYGMPEHNEQFMYAIQIEKIQNALYDYLKNIGNIIIN